MDEERKPKPPSVPVRELELDERQEYQTGLRQIELLLKRYAPFSEWLAQKGRAT